MGTSAVSTAVRTARTVGRVAGHVVWERAVKPPAHARSDVPRNADDVTPAWLTSCLAAKVSGASVLGFDNLGGSTGTTTRRRLRLTYNEVGQRAGLPEHLYVKTTTSLTQRLMLGLTDIIHVEGLVYDRVLPLLKLEAPEGFGYGLDRQSWRSFVITEDVSVTRGATFFSPSDDLTLHQAKALLTEMASWHAAMWDHPELSEGWLQSTYQRHLKLSRFLNWGKRAGVGFGRAGSVVPSEIRDQHDRLIEAYGKSMELGSRGPQTFLHGDPHCAGNYYETDTRQMGWADWGVCLRGSWGYDYSYFVTSSLPVERRRDWERELLAHYLEQLEVRHVDAPTFDDAWLTYRQQALYPCVAWAAVHGHGRMTPDSQPPEYCLPIIERTANAVVDLDSVGAVNGSYPTTRR